MTSQEPDISHHFEILESIDRAALESLKAIRVDGEPTLLHKAARRYLQGSPAALNAIRLAMGSGDAPAITRLAHSLVSSSGFLGAVRLVEILRTMQRLGESGSAPEAATLLPVLEAEFEAFCQNLAAELT